ncbi:MAG TPA: M48 family metalloprotease [Solimonas sp.]|nr:M48 family metalloprotease [Solimonas sp.]
MNITRNLFALALLAGSSSASAAGFGDFLNQASDAIGTYGQQAADVVTDKGVDEERQIGSEWAATLLGAAPLWTNDKAQRYVNEVGLWLALHSERPQLAWRFGVLDSPNVNAFATPGGYVFITRGLLARMRNEAELAGVLAHEIAHVVEKHHLEALRKAQGLGLGAGLLKQFAIKDKGNAAVNDRLLGGVKEVASRGLDKGDEYEADRMGVVIATRAGYDPYGLPAVLQTLQALNAQDSTLALMFATHPEPGARLDALDKAMGVTLEAYAAQPQLQPRFQKTVGKP